MCVHVCVCVCVCVALVRGTPTCRANITTHPSHTLALCRANITTCVCVRAYTYAPILLHVHSGPHEMQATHLPTAAK